MSWNANKRKEEYLRKQFGRNPLKESGIDWARNRIDEIQIYYTEQKHKLPEKGMIDDITWNDLEMDEVFLRINHTKSFIGEQVLYQRLHDVGRGRDWKKFEKQIEYLSENESARIEIEKKLSVIGKKEEDYHLATFLMHSELWEIKGGIWLHFLQVMLLTFFMGSIFFEQKIWLAGLSAVAIVNLMVYLKVKQQYEVFLFSLGSLKEIIKFSKWMLTKKRESEQIEKADINEAVEDLQDLTKKIVGWQSRKYASMTGDLTAILQDYLMGITLIDVAAFNHIMREIRNKQDKVLRLYEFVGQVDIMISIASYRRSMEVWCEPTFVNEGGIEGKDIMHPLLEKAISNDFSLKSRAMITGANASGKSTFMKALAINVILAQTIHTCVANCFRLPRLFVMTSMALKDDILTGESYYIREVKYLKRMLDTKVENIATLCVIDEILKGTNTKERLAASTAILDYLVETNSFVLIATHDIELVEGMKERYEQYYFESQITETDICFDYRIRKGIGGKSNAIALLELLGFPRKIVTVAEQRMREMCYENR